MRTSIVRSIVPIAVLAVACSRGGSSTAMTDDLQKDLQAASASKLELASQTGAYKPMRFVSEIEQSNGAETVMPSKAPKRVASKSAGPAPEEKSRPAPERREELRVAQAPTPQPEAPAPAAEVPSVPIVAPRPSPIPVDMPAPSTGGHAADGNGGGGVERGDGSGEGIGGVIGVVIRGGRVGVDHCPPPRRHGRPWWAR